MAFKYRRRSQTDWKRRESGGFEGFVLDEYTTYSPRKGDNYIRILPPAGDHRDEARHYGIDVNIHYGIGPERASILCPARMKGENCPICEAASKFDKMGDEDAAKELRPNKRLLVWMIDMKDEKKGAQLWAMPKSVDEAIVKISKDRSGEIFEVDHPDDGYNISFDKDGEGIGTKYNGFVLDRTPSEVDQRILDYIEDNDLYKVLRWRDYDEIMNLYKGFAAGADSSRTRSRERDDPRDDPPPRSRERARDPDPRDEPPPRSRERVNDRYRDEERDDPPPRSRERDRGRDEERDDPPPRSRERDWDRDRDPDPRDDDPPPRSRDRERPRDAVDDDEIPFDQTRDARRERARDEPPAEDSQDDPPPRARTRTRVREDAPEPESSSSSEGKSRAELLREKWGNRR